MASSYPHKYTILIVYNIYYKWSLDFGIQGGRLIFNYMTILSLAFTFSLWLNTKQYSLGYPWSNPIRINHFSLELNLIGIFLYGDNCV